MAKTIKNTIVVEGEKKYKEALRQTRQALAETRSEMKLAKSEFADQEESVQSLQAQIEVLTKQYAENEKQCRTLEEYLGKVEAAFGRNGKEASDLRIKLNNAKSAMNSTGAELSDLRKRLEEAADAGEDTGQGIEQVFTDLAGVGDLTKESVSGVGELAQALGDLAGIDLGDLAGAGGIAIAGKAAVDALKLGDNQVAAWGQMAAYTGETGAALEDMKEAAKTVYRDAFGDDLDDAAQGVATVKSYLDSSGEALVQNTESAFMLRDVFGLDIPESARTAAQMMSVFGIDGQTAFELIARAAQDGADKNGNLLDTFNEYAPAFEATGKSAEDMQAALSAAAQNGIYDVDKVGDAWKEFGIRVVDGSDTTTQALTDLGFEATDVSHKIAGGGEAADLATSEIIAALANLEDPYERNRLGVALFGTQWEDTGGRILDVFAEMEGSADDNRDALQGIADVKYDDLDTALTGLTRRLETMFGTFATPGAQAAAAWINGVNAALDSGNVSDVWNVGSSIIAEQKTGEREALMAQGYTEAEAIQIQVVGMGKDGKPQKTVVDYIKDFFSWGEETETVNAAASSAANAATSALDTALGETIPAAGEDAVTEFASGMETGTPGAQTAAEAVGEAANESLAEKTMSEATPIGEGYVLEVAGAMENRAQEAQNAGEAVGAAGADGTRSGMGDGSDLGANFGAAVASGLRSQTARVSAAAAALGAATNSGYRASVRIASPAKDGIENGELYGEGIVVGLENREEDVYLASETLGEASSEGGRSAAFLVAGDAGSGAAVQTAMIDEEALTRAFTRALDGVVLQIDSETAGRLLEKGVSIAEYDRAAASVSGRSAQRRV